MYENQRECAYVNRIWMCLGYEWVSRWVWELLWEQTSVYTCVYVCIYEHMKESKRHSQGAVSREPRSTLITGLQCVWCLLGTDSFSPLGSPFSHPFSAPCTTLSLYHSSLSSSFHSISFTVCALLGRGGFAKEHLCSRGTVGTVWENTEVPKQGFVQQEAHLRVCLHKYWHDELPSLIVWHSGWHSIWLSGKRGLTADLQPRDGWMCGYLDLNA